MIAKNKTRIALEGITMNRKEDRR